MEEGIFSFTPREESIAIGRLVINDLENPS
jgi:hypothetical protein